MRKVMKSTLVIMLTLALILTQVSMVTYADNGKGNSNNNGKGNSITIQNKVQVSEQTKLELREKIRMMVSFGQGNWEGIPNGMMKKGYLPYGLAKRYMNGDFPYGLAKRIKDFQLGQEKPPVDIEVLKALIVTAKGKLVGKAPAEYLPNEYANFEKAIDEADSFVKNNLTPKSTDVKIQIEKLKAAILKFENSKYIPNSDLTTLYNQLKAYNENYGSKLTVTKLQILTNLIAEIKLIIESPTNVLTVGKYSEILSKAKAFEDPLLALKDKIEAIKVKIYIVPNALSPVLKSNEGIDPGKYLVGSYKALENELLKAILFVKNYSSEPVVKITQVMTDLQNAEKAFDNNLVLSLEEKTTLKSVRDELFAYYTNYYKPVTNPLTALKALIDKIDLHFTIVNPKPYTQGDKTYYYDLIPTYLSDIYTQVKAEIGALVVKADAMLIWTLTDAEVAVVTPQKNALKTARDAADAASKLASPTYTVLNTAYQNLDKAMVDFEYALELFRLKGLVTVAVAEKTAAKDVDKDAVPHPNLYDKLVSALDAANALIVLADDANSTNNPTVAAVKSAFTALQTAVNAFTPTL